MSKDVPHDEAENFRKIIDGADLHMITLDLNPTTSNITKAEFYLQHMKIALDILQICERMGK